MRAIFQKPLSIFIFLSAIWWFVGGMLYLIFGEYALFKTINGFHNPILDVIAYYGTQVGEAFIMVTVILIIFIAKKEFRNVRFIITALVTLTIPALLINLLKMVADAPRPLTVFTGEKWLHFLPYYKNNFWNSLPSGHTSGAFSFAVFLSYLLHHKFKNWAIIFFLIALFCGWTRIYLAQHFFIDILLGSIIGTVFTLIIIIFINKIFNKKLLKNNSLKA